MRIPFIPALVLTAAALMAQQPASLRGILTDSSGVAISDGSIAEFEVCDYIEDAVTFHVRPGARPVSGYMELPCRAVAIHRY